jgi:hypothetical protein
MPEKDGLTAAERRKLLASRICELPLSVEGSPLGEPVGRLYSELKRSGVLFRPGVYLSDGWGCPDLVPVIGVPFYLADARLTSVVSACRGYPVEDEAEIMRYLRHETGHAFNYAYRLYNEAEWQSLYGAFDQPYPEYFPAHPFSSRFVRHIPGWYTQKHPDEDFAESFAVWLTPGSRWRSRYAGTPALAKLEYVERTFKRLGKTQPFVAGGPLDRPLGELCFTLGEWCGKGGAYGLPQVNLPSSFKHDLKDLFPAAAGEPVSALLAGDRWGLMDEVHAMTGTDSDILFALIQEVVRITSALKLKVAPGDETRARIRLAILLTTLAAHFQQTGHFVEE